MIGRRAALGIVGGGALAGRVGAQSVGRVRRIAVLRWDTLETTSTGLAVFRDRLAELGWVEGRNLAIDLRFAGGDPVRAAALLTEMLRNDPEIIVASSTPAVRSAIAATSSVPIVMAPAADPIANGFVSQLARPGGNVTGVTLGGPDVTAKQIELLRDIIPNLARIAFLGSSRDPAASFFAAAAEAAARSVGIELTSHFIAEAGELPATMAAIARSGVGALLVQPIFVFQRDVVASLALQYRLPAVSELRPLAQAGLLLTYGTSTDFGLGTAAAYVDRILHGARPGDLPVERPTRIELVVNLRTAQALGLTLPPVVLGRADELIE